jgi:hypothetical protein
MLVAFKQLGGDAALFTDPDRVPRAQPLVGVQGAKPPGLTYLIQPIPRPGHDVVGEGGADGGFALW